MADEIIKIDENNQMTVTSEELEALGLEDDEGGESLRRKDYCCRYSDGSTHTVRASHSLSAAAKCMAHKPLRPVSVSKGSC